MSNFNPKTTKNLIRFSMGVTHQLDDGIKRGLIGSSNKDKHSEICEFLRKYKNELSHDYNVNVSNILKTPKQLKFVVGLIGYTLDIKAQQ